MKNTIYISNFSLFVGNLNWWSDIGVCHRLVPLATVGDGNCLLHAASLGMWGFHDRLLTLRKALCSALISDSASSVIKRRWKLQQYQRNMEAGGLVYTDDEWEKEWREVVRLASTSRRKLNSTQKLNKNQSLPSIVEGGEKIQPVGENEPKKPAKEHSPEPTPQPASSEHKKETLNKSDVTESTKVDTKVSTEDKKEEAIHHDENEEESEGAFESLEEIHVFVLANVLRRPIIIIADKFLRDFSGDPIAPIPFGGIFLPCECPPETCLKTPLILAFESAHFSAVVASEGKGKQESLVAAIPVVNHDYQLLPIHFSVDPGESFDWSTLDKETELPSKLLLSAEQNLELLGKYLDIVHIKIMNSAKTAHSQGKVDAQQPQKGSKTNEKKKEVVKEGDKGINSWISCQFNKVGNLAGKIKGSWDGNTLCAAKLKTDQKPEYYNEMIKNYIESAKKRFEERKKILEAKKSAEPGSSQSGSYPCPTPGCQLYGRADTNYLCSGCYRTQKSASEAGVYKKPAGSEAKVEGKVATFKSYLPPISTNLDYPNSITNYDTGSTSTRNITSSTPKVSSPSYAQACQSNKKTESNRCLTERCSFYGRPDQKGFCSSCYKKMAH